jgi:hypothetical protein
MMDPLRYALHGKHAAVAHTEAYLAEMRRGWRVSDAHARQTPPCSLLSGWAECGSIAPRARETVSVLGFSAGVLAGQGTAGAPECADRLHTC